ncbi:hypothetical protein PG994_011354 [Apiospora phragmitis]|uniref:Uncharacterized protein n=1 Tax=Apiospora phragmitis TaxID=2905665 RepID=A0ABR1TV86_9PEZI
MSSKNCSMPEAGFDDMRDEANSGMENIHLESNSNGNIIPLTCFICPNSPHFSDISHLLTHISSKGHLQNKFKMDIDKKTDQGAARKMQQFDSWYQENGIEDLLRARSDAREQKQRTSQSRKPGNMTNTKGKAPGNYGSGGAMKRGRGARRNNIIRPKSRTSNIKPELEEESTSVTDGMSFAYGLQLPYWHPGHDSRTFGLSSYHTSMGFPLSPMFNGPDYSQYNDVVSGNGVDYEDEDDFSNYQAPSDEDEDVEDEDDATPFPSDNTADTSLIGIPDLPEGLTAEDAHNAKFKKGEWLKGMDVFDAASQEDRRKRNQRKDPSVLAKMQLNSGLVAQTETVCDLYFNKQRERNVYDEPSIDGSGDEKKASRTGRGRKPRVTKAPRAKSPKPRGRKPKASQMLKSGPALRGSRRTRGATRGRGGRTATAASRDDGNAVPATTRVTRSSRAKADEHVKVEPSEQAYEDGPEDVFRDSEVSSRGHFGIPFGQRPSDGLPGLALRPGHPNLNLLSPTPTHKGQHSRLYSGKENDVFAFHHEPTSNPYLPALGSHEGNSFNPLCIQSRDGVGFRPFSPYEDDAKPIANGFQSINGPNGHTGYSSLHFPSRNTPAEFQPSRYHYDNFNL